MVSTGRKAKVQRFGHGFDSHYLHHVLVAQLAEHATFNRGVEGPIPSGRTNKLVGRQVLKATKTIGA